MYSRLCLLLTLLLALMQAACATYQGHVASARNAIEAHNPEKAVAILEPLAKKDGGDQLVYVLDYAQTLQIAKQYQDSSQQFIKADKLAELQDYHSISKIAGSLLFAEELVQYKGEDFEKLLINVMAATDYVLMGKLDEAQVETRRLTDKLNYFRREGKKAYEDNPFAYYLNGHIWEANGDYDGAFIDFEKAYKLGVDIPELHVDLIRTAFRARRMEAYNKYRKKFKEGDSKDWQSKNKGELIVLFQQGWGPRKAPRPDSPRFPMLVHTPSRTQAARIVVDGTVIHDSELVYNLEADSIKNFDEQYKELIAKRMAGIVAKEVVAKQVSDRNEGLGAALWIAMHASDRADLRQWSTLPQTIQIARFYLPVGHHKVVLQGLSDRGEFTDEQSPEIEFDIKPQKKTFIGWRSVQ